MTDTNQKLRALILTAIMVLSVVAMTVSLSGSAAAISSERTSLSSGESAVVFLGEEGIDASAVTGVPASGNPATFAPVSGPGGTVSVNDAGDVDFTDNEGFEAGTSYNASGDANGDIDISVRQPRVNEINLYLGDGTSGADITGEQVPGSTSNITVEGIFNFDTATHTEVTVTDADGLDVTNQVNSTPEITNSSDTVRLDVSGLADGTYTVEVGTAVTQNISASSSVEFTLGGSGDASISLDKTDVTQGERVIATVTGTPGDTVTVRIDAADLANTTTPPTAQATQVFENTADVVDRNSSSDQIGAAVSLGNDGEGQVRILTQHLDDSNTATIEAVSNSSVTFADFATTKDDDVDLTVASRDISVSSSDRNVIVGENFDLSGTAVEADNVYAYVLINDVWEPLTDDDGNAPAQDLSVLSDGSYEITVDSSQNISVPASYQIGVITGTSVPDDGNSNNGEGLTRSFFSSGVSAKTSVSTQSGSLSASLSEDRLAKGDTLTVSGTAIGQGSTVRVYVIGPRGAVGLDNASVAAATNEFESDFDSDFSNSLGTSGGATFDRTGSHTVIVVGPGRNGNFASGAQAGVASGNLASEQVALIEDAYTGAGVDDTFQRLTFVSENAQLDMDPVGTNGQVTPGTVTVSGTSNREAPGGQDIFVDVLDSDGNVLTSETATVDGASDTWSVDVDLSDISTGQEIRITADDGTVTDSVTVDVVSSISTPAPTTTAPPQTVTVTQTVVETQTVTVTQDRTVTVTVTPSDTDSGGQPGFGIAIAIVALLGAGLLALRRRD